MTYQVTPQVEGGATELAHKLLLVTSHAHVSVKRVFTTEHFATFFAFDDSAMAFHVSRQTLRIVMNIISIYKNNTSN